MQLMQVMQIMQVMQVMQVMQPVLAVGRSFPPAFFSVLFVRIPADYIPVAFSHSAENNEYRNASRDENG